MNRIEREIEKAEAEYRAKQLAALLDWCTTAVVVFILVCLGLWIGTQR